MGRVKGVFIEAIVRQKSDLIRNLIDKHKTGDVVGVNCASFRPEQKSVVTSANVGEKGALLAHCADEFALAVEDEYLAVGAEDQHEAGQLGNQALFDLLFDVNALL